MDTENANISFENINGVDATVIEKDGWVAIVWSANSRLFVIDMDGTKDEAIKVASSVTFIK